MYQGFPHCVHCLSCNLYHNEPCPDCESGALGPQGSSADTEIVSPEEREELDRLGSSNA